MPDRALSFLGLVVTSSLVLSACSVVVTDGPEANSPQTTKQDGTASNTTEPTSGSRATDGSETGTGVGGISSFPEDGVNGTTTDKPRRNPDDPPPPAPTPDSPQNPVYDDPRGGRFAEFQLGFDRTHPFGGLDVFCKPHGPPSETLKSTDEGISGEEIKIVHLRTKIEEIAVLGFAEDVGDVQDIFEVFNEMVNTRCGGVWGRRVNLSEVEVSAISASVGQDIEALRNAACIEATEARDAVILLNTTSFQGTGVLCVVEEHNSALIGSLPFPEEYIERGQGRLITLSAAEDAYLKYLVHYLLGTGALEGRRVAVVTPNTPGQESAVRKSLLDELLSAGVDVPVYEVIDCAGGNICITGAREAVERMIAEDVDVLFPTLNAISLPSLISEMGTQGIKPGEIQIYNSDFNSQGNEVVASKVADFGGDIAGKLYDGTIMAVTGDVGIFRNPDFSPHAFEEMCMRTYRENSDSGADYDPARAAETHKYAMVSLVCSAFRTALRAIYDAGANPTRADIFSALESLGAVDVPSMLPSTLAPGKWSAADAYKTVTFRYQCDKEGIGLREVKSCLQPNEDVGWIWPRSAPLP